MPCPWAYAQVRWMQNFMFFHVHSVLLDAYVCMNIHITRVYKYVYISKSHADLLNIYWHLFCVKYSVPSTGTNKAGTAPETWWLFTKHSFPVFLHLHLTKATLGPGKLWEEPVFCAISFPACHPTFPQLWSQEQKIHAIFLNPAVAIGQGLICFSLED